MSIVGFDHVALPAARPEAMIEFYGALGFDVPDVGAWRASGVPFFEVRFGNQKINVHTAEMWSNPNFELRGPAATPGCADLCFVWEGGTAALEAMLENAEAPVIAGPVTLHGARGKGVSVYVRDPESNLLEFIIYDE